MNFKLQRAIIKAEKFGNSVTKSEDESNDGRQKMSSYLKK